MNNIIKKIKPYDIVSFDIFDTLIVRNVNNPHDIFDIVEKQFNKNNSHPISKFKENRILAEIECRRASQYEEVNLEEIYEWLFKYYDKDVVEKLKKIEVKAEIDFCQFNERISDIYTWCKKNKKVIITSDMYLDEEVIKEILRKNKIEYDDLFLSSKYRKTKNSGNLFKCILEKYETDKKIIHIGDNKKSDYISARKNRIASIRWKKMNLTRYENLNQNIISAFNNNNFNFTTYEERFGKLCFGPLIYSFCIWLKNNLKKNNIDKVFFLARDGYIIQKAFNIINQNETLDNQYFYASRRSIIVLSLWKCNNIEEMLDKIHLNKSIKVCNLLKKIGLDDYSVDKEFYNRYGLVEDKEYNTKTLLTNNNTKKMLEDLYPEIVKNSRKEYDSFLKYQKQKDFYGKIAIVDIGWFGNMQHALENLGLNADIYGYYVGIEPRKNYQNQHKMYGFLFETNKNYEYFLKEHNFNAIFEMLFLAQHGSVKRFTSHSSDYVELYPYEYENSEDKHKIIDIQNAALDFCSRFNRSGLEKYLSHDYESCFEFMTNELLYPTNEIASYFGNFKFLDDEEKYIAKPSNILKYINIKKLIRDYQKSSWRVGFLKRCFKIRLPYYKINMKIRQRYLNRGKIKDE